MQGSRLMVGSCWALQGTCRASLDNPGWAGQRCVREHLGTHTPWPGHCTSQHGAQEWQMERWIKHSYVLPCRAPWANEEVQL